MKRIGSAALGLGTAQLGDLYGGIEDATATAIVDVAWNRGVRVFDTAPHYGLGVAERRLGNALARRDRDSYQLSTKVGRLLVADGGGGQRRQWDFSERGIRASLEQSLDRLKLDRVDTLLIHDPENHMPEALGEGVRTLERLRDEGVVGSIGVGSGNLSALETFAQQTGVDNLMVAGRLTLLDQSAGGALVKTCQRRGIGILNAGVFNSGILADATPGADSHFEYEAPSTPLLDRVTALHAVCRDHGVSAREAALRFGLRYPPVVMVVVGAESAEQIAETTELADGSRDLSGLWAELERRRLIEPVPSGLT